MAVKRRRPSGPSSGSNADRWRLKAWFSNSNPHGIGIVGGTISGNLERLDFDELGLDDDWSNLCREFALEDVLRRLVVVRTPTGGSHVYYRSEAAIPGNRALARRRYRRRKEPCDARRNARRRRIHNCAGIACSVP